MIKNIFRILALYLVIQILYCSGYKRNSEDEYYIDVPEQPIKWVDTSKFVYPKRDTTKYKGKWVDVN